MSDMHTCGPHVTRFTLSEKKAGVWGAHVYRLGAEEELGLEEGKRHQNRAGSRGHRAHGTRPATTLVHVPTLHIINCYYTSHKHVHDECSKAWYVAMSVVGITIYVPLLYGSDGVVGLERLVCALCSVSCV